MTVDGPGNGADGVEGADGRDDPTQRMRFQDENTVAREPTLAERKARERAEQREEETTRAEAAELERSRRTRKRLLIGAGVTVGVVAVIAVGYAVAQPDEQVTAQCVDQGTQQIVDDANCVTPATNPTYYGGGGFYPIFLGGGGRQYYYNYGGSGSIGQPVSGGSTTVPRSSTRVSTPSGKTVSGGSGSISRGGLGSSSSGSSGS